MSTDITAGVLVIIPTYNELEALPRIVQRVRAALPDTHILIQDDNSPDGTGELAEELAQQDGHITVSHRDEKRGLGAAYIDGFRWGLDNGYQLLVQIDADGSHPPERLPAMIEAVIQDERVGLAIGSRWVSGGSVVDWPMHREILSRGANLYAGIMLGLGVRDATAGFRVYRGAVIADMDLGTIRSKGYGFQVDMSLRTHMDGWRIVELPIEFREREVGQSKMSGAIIGEAMLLVTGWGIRRRAQQLRDLFARKS